MNAPEMDFSIDILHKITQNARKVIFLYNFQSDKFDFIGNLSELWGKKIDPEKINVQKLLKDINPDDLKDVQEFYSRLNAEPFVGNMEFRVNGSDGNVRTICVEATSFFDEGNSLQSIGGILDDVTKKRRYEDNLNNYNARKNTILEILKHDIGGQWAMVKNIADLISEKGTKAKNDPEVNKLIKLIQKISVDSMDMIKDFTTEEHTVSMTMPLHVIRLDLVKRVQEIVKQYQVSEQLMAKRFQMSSSAKSIMVELDDVKFFQAISNLLSNAIKFTLDDGKISIHLEDKEDVVLITISDDGIGIPDEFKPVLFDRFTAASRPGLRGEKSVGLGMSIVKTMVERHGGKIWFESQENIGTTFYLEIPKFVPQIL